MDVQSHNLQAPIVHKIAYCWAKCASKSLLEEFIQLKFKQNIYGYQVSIAHVAKSKQINLQQIQIAFQFQF